jgi:hypothetical protein
MCVTLRYFLLERCTKRKKVRVNKVDALYIGEGSVFRPFSYTFNIIDDENIFHPKLVGPLLPIQFKRCVPTIERGLPLQTFGRSTAKLDTNYIIFRNF